MSVLDGRSPAIREDIAAAPLIPRQRGSRSVAATAASSALQGPAEGHPTRRSGEQRYILVLTGLDVVSAAIAVLFFLAVSGNSISAAAVALAVVTVTVAWAMTLRAAGAYDRRFLYEGTEEFRRIFRAGGILFGLGACFAWWGLLPVEAGSASASMLVLLLCTGAGRAGQRTDLRRRRRAGGAWMRRVVVVGQDEEAVQGLVTELDGARAQGLLVVGTCTTGSSSRPTHGVGCTGVSEVAALAERTAADVVVVIPGPTLGPAAMRRLSWQLEEGDVQVLLAPGLLDVVHHRAAVVSAGNLGLVHIAPTAARGWRRAGKEAAERVLAAAVLVLMLPAMVAVAVAIRLDSTGPALFRQQRVGRGGSTFVMFKFRTMVTDAVLQKTGLENQADGPLFKVRDDPRTTRLGRVLRRYSVDELPQLINVVLGHMSMIGPRPALPAEVAAYGGDMSRRLVVKPGITGLWQVSGRSDLSWDAAVRLDVWYVENWSLSLDLSILLRTGRAVLSHEGAY